MKDFNITCHQHKFLTDFIPQQHSHCYDRICLSYVLTGILSNLANSIYMKDSQQDIYSQIVTMLSVLERYNVSDLPLRAWRFDQEKRS